MNLVLNVSNWEAANLFAKNKLAALALLMFPLGAMSQTADTTSISQTERLHHQIDSLRGIVRGKLMENKTVRLADSLLDARDQRAKLKYDTTYITKPRERWTFKVRGNVSGSTLHTRGMLAGNDIDADLIADVKTTLSVSAAYRGFGLGVSLNPMKLAGKNKDFEYNLNSYSNRYGFDVIYTSANTYHGNASYNNMDFDVKTGQVGLDLLTLNGYYSFNHRHFSFPAAFSQSQIQLKSCGSWMIGATMLYGRTTIKDDIVENGSENKIRMFNIGVGAGYAYNFVLQKGWLLHISCIPEIVFITKSKMTVNGEEQHAPFKFPNLIVVSRAAVVKNYKTNFIGLTFVLNNNLIGDRDKLQILNNKWRVRAFWGFHW